MKTDIDKQITRVFQEFMFVFNFMTILRDPRVISSV